MNSYAKVIIVKALILKNIEFFLYNNQDIINL